MKLLRLKHAQADAEADQAIYRRLALSFRNHPMWPFAACFLTELRTKGGEAWRFYVLLPTSR